MHIVADLHLHSKYSRAVSPQMTLPVMAKVAQQKGLDLLSASDFTHPIWFKEMRSQLEETGEGIYRIKPQISNGKYPHLAKATGGKQMANERNEETKFILSTEVASIYKHNNKLRRIHSLLFAPNLEIVEKINAEFVRRGVNLNADGRPIMGLSAKQVLELILGIDERCFLIPCHVWTPHFGLYGSASGYDTMQEAFEEMTPYVYGIETGLSSDPDMNWSTPELRNRSILSTSDAHSPAKMGREATVFELEDLTFGNVKKAIMRRSLVGNGNEASNVIRKTLDETSIVTDKPVTSRILYTIEFYPEEGKYHFSGHRACKVSYGPEDVLEKGVVCPVCRKRMTEGVLYRVQQLSDASLLKRVETRKNEHGVQWFTDTFNEQPPYVKLVPLLEIVAESMSSTVASQKVQAAFQKLISNIGSEMDILLKTSIEDLAQVGGERLAEGVEKVRTGSIVIEPGYDGEYGKVEIWRHEEKKRRVASKNQLSLKF